MQCAPQELGTVRLNIETYLAGKNQPTHPSVVVFPEMWNGAKYWLAYSPYPYGNGEEENPCLAVSNDMFFWETPCGMVNPIAYNEETGCEELKDPHLVYRDDLNRLEMWYLGRLAEHLGGDGTSLLLMRKYSYDGIVWSDYEVMAATQYLSPTVRWDGEKYQMWGIGYDLWDTKGTVAYQESTDGIIWTDPVLCTFGTAETGIDIWHGSVTAQNGEYHFVYIDESAKQQIYYCNSKDGILFSEAKPIIKNEGFWDYLYRPTLVFTDKAVMCLYGVVNSADQWFLSMSHGPDIENLVGIGEEDTEYMRQLSDVPVNTQGIRYHLKETYNQVQHYLRIELLVLVVFEMIALAIFKKCRKRAMIVVFTSANIVCSMLYVCFRLTPFDVTSGLSAIVALSLLNIGMKSVLLCVLQFISRGKPHET